MRTSIFTLPSHLLFLLTPTFAIPLAGTSNVPVPSLLEAYLDFNRDSSSSGISIPADAGPASHARTRRGMELQIPLSIPPSKEADSGSGAVPVPAARCKPPPRLSRKETGRLMGGLAMDILARHENGIAFPYSADTHCAAAVELVARKEVEDSGFDARLRVWVKPLVRNVHGMKRVDFVGLLGRVGGAGVGGEKEMKEMQTERGMNEEEGRVVLRGVHGNVEFVARFVLGPVLEESCLGP